MCLAVGEREEILGFDRVVLEDGGGCVLVFDFGDDV